MNICILQHVSFEGPASILDYFQAANKKPTSKLKTRRIKIVQLFSGDVLPPPTWPDLVIIMGGPMGVDDESEFPWLRIEKEFIRDAIETGAFVLGVCLGAQLIASALGANVVKNPDTEIGWFPIAVDKSLKSHWLGPILGDTLDVLHWHGDTFELPEGAICIGSTGACKNQGFAYKGSLGNEVIGLQFHLELTLESLSEVAKHCAGDLETESPWVQSVDAICQSPKYFDRANALMAKILTQFEYIAAHRAVLHPQLHKDCHVLAESDQVWVLLNKNASIPWFIIVPKGCYRDLDDLSFEDRNQLFFIADAISDMLRERFSSEKINIGALGNVVPQLHLHVIGRSSLDPCWPSPVWGNLEETRAWSEKELDELTVFSSSLLQSKSQ